MPALRSYNQICDALAGYPLIERILALSTDRGMPAYLVGGTVRDLLIGQDTHDLDFAVHGSGLALARHVADQLKGHFVPLDRERRTGRVLLVCTDRQETSSGTSGSGPTVQYVDIASLRGDDLQSDLEGRDFTLNAMAIAKTANGWRIEDPLNGQSDLRRGIVRMASPSSFDMDPVRTLRAVRMQVQFDCTIEPQTRHCLRAAVPLLEHVSAERVRDEWFKILQLGDAAAALAEMAHLHLLQQVVPTIPDPEHLDHALATVRAIERLWDALNSPADQAHPAPEQRMVASLRDLGPHLVGRYTARICDERSYLALLKCAALLHTTRIDGAALATRWKLSKREAQLLHTAIHHYPDVQALIDGAGMTGRTIYRFFAQTGEPGIDAAMLYLADALARGGLDDHDSEGGNPQAGGVAKLLNAWFNHHETQISPPPLLSGRDIMRALDRQAGPQIGELLQALTEEQAAGAIRTRQQALAYVRRWKTQVMEDTTRGRTGEG